MAFQVLSLCTPTKLLKELHDITKIYPVDRVSEPLILLSKHVFHDEIVLRIVNEVIPLAENEIKYVNVFVYLSKKIISKRFVPYLELITNREIKEISLNASKILESKKYQVL